MLLAIDIGNSEVSLGLFDGMRLVATGRVPADQEEGTDAFAFGIGEMLAGRRVAGAVMGSVVPSLTPKVARQCRSAAGVTPKVVSMDSDTGLTVRYASPQRLGIDRLLNASAAWDRCRGASIVVDFGTATTFDVVNRSAEYLGGAIFPGLLMAARALSERTASLPFVEPARPQRVIGDTTEDSIRSALYFGYAGMVDRMCVKIREELGEDARVLATGGLAAHIAGECLTIDEVVPFLTMEGLRVVYGRMGRGEEARHED